MGSNTLELIHCYLRALVYIMFLYLFCVFVWVFPMECMSIILDSIYKKPQSANLHLVILSPGHWHPLIFQLFVSFCHFQNAAHLHSSYDCFRRTPFIKQCALDSSPFFNSWALIFLYHFYSIGQLYHSLGTCQLEGISTFTFDRFI